MSAKLFCLYLCIVGINATSSSIPPHLIKCYNGEIKINHKLPRTVPVLVDLINQIELNDNTIFNIRMLTAAILHGVIFDGILESSRVVGKDAIPFRAKGHEFYKYKMVVDYLISKGSSLDINESLPPDEFCQLHYILSNSVDSRVRGDEETTCFPKNITNMPIPFVELQMPESKTSFCPIVKGNINAKWGSINAGSLIYASSAVLQDSKPTFAVVAELIDKTKTSSNDVINTLWISTLAADLAETVLNQADDKLKIGTGGYWNDNNLPTMYYLSDNNYELTESKILGNIDGIILAKHLLKWKEYLDVTRFSQIIDMYYSNGVVFNTSVRASNRNILFREVIQEFNDAQIFETAKLFMEIGTYDNQLFDADLKTLSLKALEEFLNVADKLTKHYDSIDYVKKKSIQSPLEIILIIDGSFPYETTLQIIYALVEAAQVSFYDTKLGIINGENGQWMSNVTGRPFQLFADLEKAESAWPSQLKLHHSLDTINTYYQNKTTRNCTIKEKPLGKSIIILSSNGRLPDYDQFKSREMLVSIKNTYPETNVLFVFPENALQEYEFLTSWFKNVTFLSTTDNVSVLSDNIVKILSDIPGQIVDLFCQGEQTFLEDYLTPKENRFYEIYEKYFDRGSYEIKFTGSDYGEINICAFGIQFYEINSTCRVLTVNNEVAFSSGDLCPLESKCNLQFNLNVTDSNFRCAEIDCRFPNQVRLRITWSKSGSSTPRTANLLISMAIILAAYAFT